MSRLNSHWFLALPKWFTNMVMDFDYHWRCVMLSNFSNVGTDCILIKSQNPWSNSNYEIYNKKTKKPKKCRHCNARKMSINLRFTVTTEMNIAFHAKYSILFFTFFFFYIKFFFILLLSFRFDAITIRPYLYIRLSCVVIEIVIILCIIEKTASECDESEHTTKVRSSFSSSF